MSESLALLSREYVRLSDALDDVCARMRATLLSKGAAPGQKAPVVNFQQLRRSGKRAPLKLHPNAIRFAKVTEVILTQLRERPSSTAEIARVTESKTSSTVERLKKLTARGLVQRDGQGLYSVASA